MRNALAKRRTFAGCSDLDPMPAQHVHNPFGFCIAFGERAP